MLANVTSWAFALVVVGRRGLVLVIVVDEGKNEKGSGRSYNRYSRWFASTYVRARVIAIRPDSTL